MNPRIRYNIADFVAAVSAASRHPVRVYKAVPLAGPLRPGFKITLNGDPFYARVVWDGPGSRAATDANPTGEQVTIYTQEGTLVGKADMQSFLNTLK